MKRLLWIPLCLLLCGPCHAMNAASLGGGVSSACTPTEKDAPANYATGTSTSNIGSSSANVWKATKFTAGSSYTCYQVKVRLKMIGTVTTGTLTGHLWDDSSNNPNSATVVNSTNTLSAATIASTCTEYTFLFAGKSITSPSVYWKGLNTDTQWDTTNRIAWCFSTSDTGVDKVDDNGTGTWANNASYYLGAETLGCSP